MKALMNSSGSMGPRKYPCMFLRNCSLRVLAGRAAFALYWLEPLGVSLVGVEWNCLAAMMRRVNDEKRAAPHSQIYEGSSDPQRTRGAAKQGQQTNLPSPDHRKIDSDEIIASWRSQAITLKMRANTDAAIVAMG